MASRFDELYSVIDAQNDKIKELEEIVKYKDALLRNRTESLYHMIQQAQDALNKLPEGMVG